MLQSLQSISILAACLTSIDFKPSFFDSGYNTIIYLASIQGHLGLILQAIAYFIIKIAQFFLSS